MNNFILKKLLLVTSTSFITSACTLDAKLLSSSLSNSTAVPVESNASLVFSIQQVEFGEVQIGTSNSRIVTIINQGSEEATGLRTWKLNFPFKYFGGDFPGIGGTCGATLAAGASCSLTLEFSAYAPASFRDDFEIKYEYTGVDHTHSLPLIAAANSTVHAVDVRAGVMMFCARLSNGSLRCWGEGNYGGQLGNGINYSSYNGEASPVTPLQMSSGVLDFDMTWAYSCALKTGGEVWCWGTFTPGHTWSLNPPHQVINSGAVKIAIGSATSGCAIMNTGLIKCWGDNNHGILGNGSSSGSGIPAGDVLGLTGTFVDLSVGQSSACAVKSNGEVWCWGSNSDGGMAKSAGAMYTTAVQAENMPSGIVEIESGASYENNHCVIVETGVMPLPRKVYCWGTSYGTVPVEIAGVSGAVKNLHSTMNTSSWCVTAEDETHLKCWESGNHALVEKSYGLTNILKADMAGYTNTFCGISNQHVYCWGEHKYGMLGIGGAKSKISSAAPVEIPSLSNIVKIAMDENGYAIDSGGALYCWGKNSSGACGAGNLQSIPLAKQIFSSGVSDVATIGSDTCISRNGGFYCAGSSYHSSFHRVGSAISNASEIDGYAHFCGLANGAAYCWGWSDSAVLGVNSCVDSCNTTPQAVQNMNVNVTDISTGFEHSCAIKSGQVYCWGLSSSNQLGSAGGDTAEPRLIDSAYNDFIEVDSGYERSCATRASGGIICWGSGMGPALLPGTAGVVASSIKLDDYGSLNYVADGKMYRHDGATATEMSTNWSHYYNFGLQGGTYYATCGILLGKVSCSGSNVFGNFGLSDPSPATVKDTPFPVFDLYP